MTALKNFTSLSRQFVSAAVRDMSRATKLFEQKAPEIADQIRTDARRRGPLSFWGRSRNVDELAAVTIVDPAIIELISSVADRPISSITPHAGLQHTYGYLFSTVETPYGFKRDRWVETDIETAFGLDASTLGPYPKHGTLLTNATWFAGQIAFRNKPAERKRLHRFLATKVSPELPEFSPQTGRHIRLMERVSLNQQKKKRSWTLQTDIVTSSKPGRQSVLVYSAVDHQRDLHQLITLFPVGAGVVKELRNRSLTQRRTDIRSRYNAYIPGLPNHELKGSCRLKKF